PTTGTRGFAPKVRSSTRSGLTGSRYEQSSKVPEFQSSRVQEGEGDGVKPDLAVDFAGLKLNTPVLVASGTFGYAEEFKDRMNLNALGGIIVKSLTREPRGGNAPQRIAETASGMLNSIGLQNVGIDAFIREKLPFLRSLDVPIVANVAGTTMEDYEDVCRQLAAAGGVAAVE